MATERDLPRLNLLLEFLADCAQVIDQDSLLRVASGKVRWIVPFEWCTVALVTRGEASYWCVGREHEAMHSLSPSEMPEGHELAIRRAIERNLPVVEGTPARLLCHPLQSGTTVVGGICVSDGVRDYSFHDMRFAQFIAQHIGITLGRLQHEVVQRENRAKDEFLALLSHELRNPLAPILAAAHILRIKAEHRQPELEIIERQTHHLMRLVDDLLDVARLTRGKITLNKAPVRIAEVIGAALESCKPLLEENAHGFALDDAAPEAKVHADADRLQQVFVNLFSNAARYTLPRGKIEVRIRRDAADIVVAVSDNGVGIAADVLPKIFDSFFQDEAVRGRNGLGLGLAIAKSLVQLHGGSIDAASTLGLGSVFTVKLPALSTAESVSSASRTAPAAPLGASIPQRVLVVDDNRDAADTIAQMLRLDGHEVVTSYDAASALEICRQFRPSVGVLDISMPGMSGYELARALLAALPTPPYLIALSGLGGERDRRRAAESGFGEYLVKPADPAAILERIALIRVKAPGKPTLTAGGGNSSDTRAAAADSIKSCS
jgi:signal transduction histidine kinase/ActR/RegA family two-component response regulator